jgi:hypothetical protein
MDEDKAATDRGKVSTVYNNFEIFNLDFWHSKAYTMYYEVSNPQFQM